MKLLEKRKPEEIINRLYENFHAENQKELNHELGQSDQDFISRGFYSSTLRVSKLIEIHYEYITDLIKSIIKSLENDYSNLSPVKCKPHLDSLIQKKYEELDNKVPGWLNQSQMLESSIIKAFKDNVNQKKRQAGNFIDNSCHLWEDRWRIKQKDKRINFIKWFLGSGLGVTLFVLVVRGCFLKNGSEEANMSTRTTSKAVAIDPNTGRTPLIVRTRDRVEKVKEFIIKEKIDPWIFMEIIDFKVTKADGSLIAYSGIKYSGSPVTVFWSRSFIDPFIKEGIQKVLDETGQECKENNLNAEAPLKEAGMILRSMIWNVYNRMAEVDAKLRQSNDKQTTVHKKDITDRAEYMEIYLNEQLLAALELYKS